MPLDWSAYEGFDWSASTQSPLSEVERREIERLAAGVLQLSAEMRGRAWGMASPPGRYAATVVRVADGIEHVYSGQAETAGVARVGVKVYKGTTDARREAAKLLPFHQRQVGQLPGLPSPHVQRSLTALVHGDRLCVVQEWVDGDLLEDLVRRHWPKVPASGTLVTQLIQDLYAGLVFPLWGAGTVWWDVRDANFIVREGRLVLIDVDSLGACAVEILAGAAWNKREEARPTALSRLRTMTQRVVLGLGMRPKKRVEECVGRVWREELAPVLGCLGREDAECEGALRKFLGRLGEEGMLGQNPL